MRRILVSLAVGLGALFTLAPMLLAVSLNGTGSSDVLRGGPAPDTINGKGGADVLIGLGSGDRLLGKADSDRLLGGNGPDVQLGGAGNDVLLGEAGNDRLTGDGGVDRFVGGADNDIIHSRDANGERVSCGPGFDTVIADLEDKVSGSCERVSLPAPPRLPPGTISG
jgi:serralysin